MSIVAKRSPISETAELLCVLGSVVTHVDCCNEKMRVFMQPNRRQIGCKCFTYLICFYVTMLKAAAECNKSTAVAVMGDCGHNRHGPKRGGALCPLRGELGPRLMQCGLGRRLHPYQVASSSIQPYGHNRHKPKTWGCASFMGEGAATPSNTMSPGPRFTSVSSAILIHTAVWPQ